MSIALHKLPRAFLATAAIGAGIALIVLNDRPHQLCDTQINHFQSVQKADFTKLINECRMTNSPGGCYDLFSHLKKLLRNFRLVSPKCFERLSLISLSRKPHFKQGNLTAEEKKYFSKKISVKEVLFDSIELMSRLAYRGEETLSGVKNKLHWLGPADLSLFCSLKEVVTLFYGGESLKSFENQILKTLPGTEKVSLKTLRKNSILSENCSLYL